MTRPWVLTPLVEQNYVEQNMVYRRLLKAWPNRPFKPFLQTRLWWPCPVRSALQRPSVDFFFYIVKIQGDIFFSFSYYFRWCIYPTVGIFDCWIIGGLVRISQWDQKWASTWAFGQGIKRSFLWMFASPNKVVFITYIRYLTLVITPWQTPCRFPRQDEQGDVD